MERVKKCFKQLKALSQCKRIQINSNEGKQPSQRDTKNGTFFFKKKTQRAKVNSNNEKTHQKKSNAHNNALERKITKMAKEYSLNVRDLTGFWLNCMLFLPTQQTINKFN